MTIEELQQRAIEKRKAMEESPRSLIRVGTATCGLAAGAGEVIEAIEKEVATLHEDVTILHVGCIGCCYAEPLVDIKKPGKPRIMYDNVTPDTVREIIKDYFVNDNPRPDLAMGTIGNEEIDDIPRFFDLPYYKPQVRLITENCGTIDPRDIDQYIASGGFEGLHTALSMSPEEVIAAVKASGLRGRGGAGFPTGLKWDFCRKAHGSPKYLICNADEGDPGAFMDRSVLEGDCYRVLEGMLIGGYAIGASEGYIYCRAEYPLAVELITNAIERMKKDSLVGDSILGSDFSFQFHLFLGAGAFVCGEETALINSIMGKAGRPRPRPPFPAESGLFDKPTNINNVETWGNIPWILRHGADAFASYGTATSKGTKTLSLTGKVQRTGLIEVPMGITINEIVYEIGGGMKDNAEFKAVQTGGPSGGSIPYYLGDTPVDYETLTALGTIMGSGGLVAMDDRTCMVDMARYFLEFTRGESCGQCTPCREGTKQMYRILDRICKGEGKPEDIPLLKEMAEIVIDSSLCGLGQTLGKTPLTTLNYFLEEYEEHINKKYCRARTCKRLSPAPCQAACPVGIDVPTYNALIAWGRFDDALEVIREDNPFPAVSGWMCPHPCEKDCVRAETDKAISICALKRFVADNEIKRGVRRKVVTPNPLLYEEKIAIIGGGLTGLSAAHDLRKAGYPVTVFESKPFAGGMLKIAVPDYKLPPHIVDYETSLLERDVGVEIKTNVTIGKDVTIENLKQQGYTAFLIAIGAHKPVDLQLPGFEGKGCIHAIEFLKRVKAGKHEKPGDAVAVIGFDHTAIDAARTAARLGSKVTIIYPRTREHLPVKEDTLKEVEDEHITFHYLALPAEIVRKKDGSIKAVRCQPTELQESYLDTTGRRRVVPIEGSELLVPATTVMVSIGMESDLSDLSYNLTTNELGLIITDPVTLETSEKGIFAAGDAVNGPATIIEAIAAGQKAAASIQCYLCGEEFKEPYKLVKPRMRIDPAEVEEGTETFQRPDEMTRAPEERLSDFDAVRSGLTETLAVCEAKRCLRCDYEEEEEVK
ncbi:MAG: FAD-dependent oxidoreductase [Deltaproteobacteria bacterium]|nr:FAD-dependent oxidoreductase [Deltaproteobacteria bacterium]